MPLPPPPTGQAVLHLFINTFIFTFPCLWSCYALHMPQPHLSHPLRVNLNSPSYMKPFPFLPAKWEYSCLLAILVIFIPFIASPPSAFCCSYLYTCFISRLVACSLLESHVLYGCVYFIPPNSLPCALCTVDVYRTELLNNRCYFKSNLYIFKSFTIYMFSVCSEISLESWSGSPCKPKYMRPVILFVLLNCSLSMKCYYALDFLN